MFCPQLVTLLATKEPPEDKCNGLISPFNNKNGDNIQLLVNLGF